MDVRNAYRPVAISALLVASIGLAPAAMASADSAVKACKAAILEEQGAAMSTRLKKIKTRGNSYETWFNLSDGDSQLKAYCMNRRGTTEVITSEGSWKGRNPQRPDAQTS